MIPLGIILRGLMSSVKELGALVAKVRKAQGISQLELSQAADVGRRFVVELEDGKDTIQAGKMLKVMSVLGIRVQFVEPQGV